MDSTIKKSTTVFAIAPLLLFVLSKVVLLLQEDSVSVSLILGAYIAEFIFVWHLLFENKKADWLYSIPLVLIIFGCIGSLLKIMHWPYGGILFLCGLLGTLIIACLFVYDAIKARTKTILIIIGFVLIILGTLFQIMHWPFGGIMFMSGLIVILGMVCVFAYDAIKTGSQTIRYEQLILSLCIFTQFAVSFHLIGFHGSFWSQYIKFLHYPIAALCGTILLKKMYVNLGERNLILYLLVHSLFIIIKQTFQLFI